MISKLFSTLLEGDTLWAVFFFTAPKNLSTTSDVSFWYVAIVRGTHVGIHTSAYLDAHGTGGDRAFSDLLGDELIGYDSDEGGEIWNSNAICARMPFTLSSSAASFGRGCSSITRDNDYLLVWWVCGAMVRMISCRYHRMNWLTQSLITRISPVVMANSSFKRLSSTVTACTLAYSGELLENTPWEPVGNTLSRRFSNWFPQTETNGLVFRYRIFQPVP